MNTLKRYVGRVVRLNQQAFREIAKRYKKPGQALENFFLVAEIEVRAGMRRLICYGASLRITVDVADVVLV